MAFEPDLIVTTPEGLGVSLVVEAKLALPDRKSAEPQLKQYMLAMRCPVGLLATPEKFWIYRNNYMVSGERAIEPVGEFSVPSLQRFGSTSREGSRREAALAFEEAVHEWLESLHSEATREGLPPEVRETVEENLVPALDQGQLRAAGPRQ